LAESLQQQTATADVFKVISRSTFELQVVLDTLVESAVRLCEDERGLVFRREGETYKSVAYYNYSPEFRAFHESHPITPGRGTAVGRTALEGKTVQIVDILADPEYTFVEAQKLGGGRATLAVPLLREGAPIGALVLQRTEPRPYTRKQIELVETFADQAVIAIENARLLNELRESLERQTATSEVLQVISSSPGELEPVFQALLKNAMRICDAKFGNLWLREGNNFRIGATQGAPPAYAKARRHQPVVYGSPINPLSRIIETKKLQHIIDFRTEQAYIERDPGAVVMVEAAGARTVLLVPMLKENEPIGVVAIYRQEVLPFTDKQIELSRTSPHKRSSPSRMRGCSKNSVSPWNGKLRLRRFSGSSVRRQANCNRSSTRCSRMPRVFAKQHWARCSCTKEMHSAPWPCTTSLRAIEKAWAPDECAS
jgi:GAF domain-containing protein